MKILILGIELLIDVIDLDLIRDYNWHLHGGHLRATIDGKHRYLHHMIVERMGIDCLDDIDHIDGNPVNNQRDNLRPASRSQNQANRGKPKNNTSGFKGVSWHRNKWQASIRVNYKPIHLGYFDDPIEAARTYDRAALKYFGKFANLNFPREDYE